jgi:hypothetical protein
MANSPKTYGSLKVTEAELQAARNVSCGDDATADAAYQVVRYCSGQVFNRSTVEEYLSMARTSAERVA